VSLAFIIEYLVCHHSSGSVPIGTPSALIVLPVGVGVSVRARLFFLLAAILFFLLAAILVPSSVQGWQLLCVSSSNLSATSPLLSHSPDLSLTSSIPCPARPLQADVYDDARV